MRRILVVEDSRTQAEQLRLILTSRGFDVTVASDAEKALELFEASPFDLVLTDVAMPGLSGFELCRRLKAVPVRGRTPVVLLTTLSGPLDILEGLDCGADNYVIKPYRAEALLQRLDHILNTPSQHGESRLKLGFEFSFLGRTFTLAADKGQILDLFLSACEDVVQANRDLSASQDKLERVQSELERRNRQLTEAHDELEQRVRARTTELAQANEALQREIEERKRAEEELRRREQEFHSLAENLPDIVARLDDRLRHVYVNRRIEALTGMPAGSFLGKTHRELGFPEELVALWEESLKRALVTGRETALEFTYSTPEGKRHFESRLVPERDQNGPSGVLSITHDVTERRRLEEQFRQAQKMEAVGRLAGGVAHDFNNLLTIINGYSEVLETSLETGGALREYAVEISQAGERAAALTRQLLAFSRQQVVAPKVLDLNAVVADIEKMLRRIIGEDVALAWVPDPALGRVRIDPSLVEQVLLNLAVNARDAMPKGGNLTIETANAVLDEAYARTHPEVRPGRYVQLAVSDTGVGMDDATKARIFDPFFTTKAPGKGTGLGLATVYGIVKQANGHVAVYSEPGRGATFKVYLPRIEEPLPAPAPQPRSSEPRRGNETILLAEDDDAVRSLTRLALQAEGYVVLEARQGDEALKIGRQHAGPIDLLISDVVMPGGGGRELAERLAANRPELRVLYLSGYTDDAIVRHGVLDAEAAFLQKPFTMRALALKVREVLEGKLVPSEPEA
jgi:PAS domain S-box-containing protein